MGTFNCFVKTPRYNGLFNALNPAVTLPCAVNITVGDIVEIREVDTVTDLPTGASFSTEARQIDRFAKEDFANIRLLRTGI